MISSDQFLQCDVRLRQAKMKPSQPFGGLAMNICGDFLQLPPVDKDGSRRSLAMALDDVGQPVPTADDEAPEIIQADASQAEARQGYELWAALNRIVCLTVNVRAPDVLGRLQ